MALRFILKDYIYSNRSWLFLIEVSVLGGRGRDESLIVREELKQVLLETGVSHHEAPDTHILSHELAHIEWVGDQIDAGGEHMLEDL